MKLRIFIIPTLIFTFSAASLLSADVHGNPAQTADAVLKKEHTVILKVVNAVREDVGALREGKAVSSTRIEKALDFFTNFADACHHRKEEMHYFPEIKNQGEGPQHLMVSSFLNDHTMYRVLMDRIRDGISGETVDPSIADPLAHYLSAVSLHICRENMFFGKAQPWLSSEKENALLKEFQEVEEELGPDFHKKYSRIAQELAGY